MIHKQLDRRRCHCKLAPTECSGDSRFTVIIYFSPPTFAYMLAVAALTLVGLGDVCAFFSQLEDEGENTTVERSGFLAVGGK